MNFGLKGKVAVVAGSSQGLGRAIADALAAEGVDLVINSRSQDKLDAVKAEIADATGARVEAVATDLTVPAGAARLISEAEAAFGRVDILVTNTGGPPAGKFEEHSAEVWRDAIAQVRSFLEGRQVVIADGHHRYETALAYRDEQLGSHVLFVCDPDGARVELIQLPGDPGAPVGNPSPSA